MDYIVQKVENSLSEGGLVSEYLFH